MLCGYFKYTFFISSTQISKPGEKYKVIQYMHAGSHYQKIEQRTRWSKAHKVFCYESEFNHRGTCVFYFKTNLRPFPECVIGSHVCY